MPRQNRVTPFGEIVASPARGTLMGNRGCLHAANGQVTKAWARKAWVTCLLSYNGRQREVMAPGQYTELFFLDEATALAAGHRPCGTCQKERYKQFKDCWIAANRGVTASPVTSIGAIDEYLHDERHASNQAVRYATATLGELPDGCFVFRDDRPGDAWLYWQGQLHRWEPAGYQAGEAVQAREVVRVITPPSIVRMLREGYIPKVVASATP